MPRYEFKIGEAFPASNVIARFVSVLAMIHNDWLRSMTFMQESAERNPDEGQGTRLVLARQQFAFYHEAVTFINESRGHYHPDIGDFIDSLGDAARAHYDALMAPLAQVEQWLEEHRDVTFHYPWGPFVEVFGTGCRAPHEWPCSCGHTRPARAAESAEPPGDVDASAVCGAPKALRRPSRAIITSGKNQGI